MMNAIYWNKRVQWMYTAAGIILISSLAGCNREEAKVYHVPKEETPPAQPELQTAPQPSAQPAPAATSEAAPPPADMGLPSPASAMGLPQLKYQLPPGWQEKPLTEMRVASFAVSGPNGKTADVSVIPLPIAGHDLELVNMWRARVQLPTTSDPNAVNQAVPVSIGTEQGRLFEFASDPSAGKNRQRLVVAMLTRGPISWFFKITGEDAFVSSQKESFLQFLKSVSFEEGAQPQTPSAMIPLPAPQNQTPNAPSIWTIPSGWQSVPPSQFLLAEFSIPGANSAKAEVNVAEMGGEGGGLLANVNRWRGQLGLSAASENDLPQLAKPLDVPDGKATQVDFTGTDAKTGAPTRLVAVIVLQSDRTWFYKLMGDGKVVAQQKDAFTKFIQSANYANAR
jgi:hypothetical protein